MFKKNEIQKRQTSIVKGSLADIAKATGKSIAQTFVDAECIAIIDVSGSMADTDTPSGDSRYTVACAELEAIQNRFPGKVAVISFSNEAKFCPAGIPSSPSGGTELGTALTFTKIADISGMKFIVISDGQPKDGDEAMRVAKTYNNHIDVIFVGSETSPVGRDFLRKLAAASGGQSLTADRVSGLSAQIQKLLTVTV